MFITMSTSCAPSRRTSRASSTLLAVKDAPSGNPITTPTGTPVPRSASTANGTQQGFTMAQAKRYSDASAHSWITCSRVASGFNSVWSSTAASAHLLLSASAVKAAAAALILRIPCSLRIHPRAAPILRLLHRLLPRRIKGANPGPSGILKTCPSIQ